MPEKTQFEINGRQEEVSADPETSLLEILRNELGLTGAKYGCGEGQCGSCTVIIDGRARRSCITPLSFAQGKKVLTIEGLEKNGVLHPIQAAFIKEDAMQCGYCIPGMIMSAYALLEENKNPTSVQIKSFMQGNICRCCTYQRIEGTVKTAAEMMKEDK